VGNLLSAIKFAKYYELGDHDIVLTVLTDSMEMYGSRLAELNQERGEFIESDAVAAYHQYLLGLTIDYVQELTYYERKRIHNLKYYTWVEQQGKSMMVNLNGTIRITDRYSRSVEEIDSLIEEFNAKTGLLKRRSRKPRKC
jgi:hypothetical protein